MRLSLLDVLTVHRFDAVLMTASIAAASRERRAARVLRAWHAAGVEPDQPAIQRNAAAK
jgi:hypothetical protein